MKERLYSNEMLDGCRLRRDVLADQVIAEFFPGRKNDLNELLISIENNDWSPDELLPDSFKKLAAHSLVLPPWLDVEKFERGQAFYSRNASDIMLLLGFLSLPYCYAAAHGAEVLIRSNRIKENPEIRLTETAQFVFDVMAPDAFEPGGEGFASIIKVRLMHAAIRWYIAQSDKWDDSFGQPINQEDMAGTNLSFSLLPVRGLRKMGKKVSGEDAEAFIYYWNVVGHLLGVEEALLPASNKQAYLLEKRIRIRQFAPSASGRALTKSLLKYFERATVGTPVEGLSGAFVRFLLGEEVSGLLDIEADSWNDRKFGPYRTFLRLRNTFMAKEDDYWMAKRFFETQQKAIQDNPPFSVPFNISD